MKCGSCLKNFNGWLALKNHENKVHGIKNFMDGHASVKEFQGGSADRKEREAILDQRLHDEIEKLRHRR